ncbi:MAG: Uma2 family endonuclease [Myxococcales bacterium]|nr:Uma2 family endonuclease [Myxococcales bacterium]
MANNDTSTAPRYELAPAPDVSRLVTEDGAAVDNWASEKTQRLLTSILYDSWKAPSGVSFVAAANVALYSAINRPPIVPDVMVSLEVEVPEGWWEKRNRCYFSWEFGKPPELAIEIVSDRDGLELSAKLRQYARASVAFYVVFDPQRQLSDAVLQSFALNAGQYEELDRPWFEPLGLGLALWQGSFEGREDRWLRWIDAQGAWIPTGAERAEQERARAEQERARAERLAERLRALGIDPE